MSSRCLFRILVALAVMLLGVMPSFGLEAAPGLGEPARRPTPAREGLSQAPEGVGRVSFVHAAPFAEAITDTVVTVTVDGVSQPGVLTYGDTSPYFGMAAGTYDIGIVPTGATDPVVTATVTIAEGQDYTLAVAGDGANQPVELIQTEDNWEEPGPGLAALRLVHLAPVAADLAATAVDIRNADGTLVAEGVIYGTFGGFVEMPAGIIDLMVTDPADPETILLNTGPIVLKDGDVMTLFEAGGANNWPLEPLATIQAPQDPAHLRLAHLAPFAAEVGETSVSVFLEDTEVASAVTYGATTDYFELPPAMYTVSIVPTGEMTPAITGTVTLMSGVDYTAIAIGDGTLQPLDLLATMDNIEMPTPRMSRLRVVHVAPFSDDPALTAVDVRDAEGEVFAGLEGVTYGTASEYVEVAADTYDLVVTIPGGEMAILDIPPLTLMENQVATLYVIGDGETQPLDALLVTDEMRMPTDVQFANLAPFAPDLADTAITVALNEMPIAEGLTFGQATDFMALPAGFFDVAVVPEIDMAQAIGGAMFLTWDMQYIATVIGDNANWPLDLFVLRDIAQPDEGMAGLRIVHVAPFTSTLEATAVNVVADNGEPFDDVEGLTYKDVTAFIDVAPGVYDLAVTNPDGAVVVDIAPFRLVAGQSVTVFIVGDGVNQPLDAVIPGVELGTVIYLPIVFRDFQRP